MGAQLEAKEENMSIITRVCSGVKNHVSIPSFPVYVNTNAQMTARRWFSSRSHDELSYPVGPRPTEPLQPGDPGYSRFLKNIEFFRKHGRDSYLSHTQAAELAKTPQSGEKVVLEKLFQEIKNSQQVVNQEYDRMLKRVFELISSRH